MAVISTPKQGNAVTTSMPTNAIDTTGKTVLIVATAAFQAANVDTDAATTITDSKSNTYTRVGRSVKTGQQWVGLYICSSPTVGTAHTATYNVTGSTDMAIVFAAWDGSLTVLDQGSSSSFSTGGAGANTAVATPQITTTSASELLISVYSNDDAGDVVTQSNGGSSTATWTKQEDINGNVGVRITLSWASVSATGTFSAGWSSNSATTVAPKGIMSLMGSGGGFDPSLYNWSLVQLPTVGSSVVAF
jgi:hypothetical protein